MNNNKPSHSADAAGYRAKAADCAATASTGSPQQRTDARNSERAFKKLAENEDWLAENSDKLI